MQITKKKKMFFETIYYFFKISGLVSITINLKLIKENDLNHAVFSTSKLGLLHCILLSFILIITNFISLNYIVGSYREARTQFDRLSHIFKIMYFYFSASSILLIFSLRQNTIIKMAKTIYRIIYLINFWNKNDRRQSFQFIVKTMCIVNSFLWPMIIATYFFTEDSVLFNFGALFAHFIINWMVILYGIIFYSIYYLLEILNLKFLSIFEDTASLKDSSLNINDVATISFSKIKKNQFFQIRALYLSLLSVTKDISNFFNFPLFMCMFRIFISLLLYLNYSLKAILFKIDNESFLLYAHEWIWIVLLIFELIILTKSSSVIVNEVIIFQ